MAAGLEPLLDTVSHFECSSLISYITNYLRHARNCYGGTSPTFFKIPVSMSLLTHIRRGMCPRDVTAVTFCQPPVPRPERRWSEGMMPLDSRRQILGCYEAFKMVMGI